MKHFLLICLVAGSLFSLGMTGGTPETVVVPNVEGVSLELAAQVLRNAGLQPQGQSAALSARVSRQEPRPGFEVSAGSVVVLFVEGQSQTLQRDPVIGPSASANTSQNPRAIVQSPQIVPSTQPVGGGRMWNMHVTVTPQDPTATAIQGQSRIQAGTLQETRPALSDEPWQAAATRYSAQTRAQRAYPAWYPRQFIPESASSTSTVAATSPQFQPGAPPLFSADTVSVGPTTSHTFLPEVSTGNATILYYPAVDAGADGVASIQSSDRVGLIRTSASPAVSVPKVTRLPQQDAIAALTKAGLAVGAPTVVDSAQGRSGDVVQQSPQPRQLVPAGTQIRLWIAR